jgi:hypothetical protein
MTEKLASLFEGGAEQIARDAVQEAKDGANENAMHSKGPVAGYL